MPLVNMYNRSVHMFRLAGAAGRLRRSMYMHVMHMRRGVARNICASEALGKMRTLIVGGED